MKPRTKMKTKTLLLCLLGSAFLSNVSALAVAQDIPKEASYYAERLPPKIQKIQKELPTWIEMPGNKEKAAAFMQKLKEHLDAKNFAEAEKTADAILKMMGLSSPAAGQSGENKSPPSNPSSDDTVKRLTAKVERVQAGAQKWAASGRDPSTIGKAMEEKFKPLMEAGKVVEAEAELDRVLEQLKADGKGTPTPAAPAEAAQQRVAAKVERVTQAVKKMTEGGNDPSAILKTMGEKVGPLLDSGKFIEAEVELDRVLKQLGQDAK